MADPSSVPTSINFAGALLFDDKANFVAITSGSTLNVTQSYLPVMAKGDNGIATPLSIASGTVGLKVVHVGTRNIIGQFACSINLLTGAATPQNLFSIENPAASGRSVIIKRLAVDGVANATATVVFLYRVGRTNGLPSGGTTQSAQKSQSNNPSPVAVIRSSPSGSLAAGSMWVYSPGVVATLVGSIVPNIDHAVDSELEVNDVVLFPGEGLIIKADANTTAWSHFGWVVWQEAT